MATHHGRPGGRGLELLLLFALLALTFAVVGLTIYLAVSLFVGFLEFLPGRGNVLPIFGLFLFACGLPAFLFLKWLWRNFLGYYKYDPNSLKPLTQGTPDDRKSD